MQSVIGGDHGFVLTDAGYSQFDVPDSIRTAAWRINNAGQIVGWYFDADGKLRGFVATPQ
jgi:hypothetical protein